MDESDDQDELLEYLYKNMMALPKNSQTPDYIAEIELLPCVKRSEGIFDIVRVFLENGKYPDRKNGRPEKLKHLRIET